MRYQLLEDAHLRYRRDMTNLEWQEIQRSKGGQRREDLYLAVTGKRIILPPNPQNVGK